MRGMSVCPSVRPNVFQSCYFVWLLKIPNAEIVISVVGLDDILCRFFVFGKMTKMCFFLFILQQPLSPLVCSCYTFSRFFLWLFYEKYIFFWFSFFVLMIAGGWLTDCQTDWLWLALKRIYFLNVYSCISRQRRKK